MDLQRACEALRRGEIVLLYDADGREEETDMVIASEHATPQALRTLRGDAGGLVCTTLAPEHHRLLGLPWLSDVLQGAAAQHPVLRAMVPDDITYDASKPAFGITVNHRSTFTGITDADRATTIQELATFCQAAAGRDAAVVQAEFGAAFRTPGHVTLLNGQDDGLAARQGHTELSIELLRQAGLTPSATICEMLGRDGRALSRADAEAYAKAHGLVFLTGAAVVAAWRQRTPAPRPATRARQRLASMAPVPTSAS